MNMDRLNKSAMRLALPEFDEKELLECIKKLVRLEKDWIPEGKGYSLYIRPTMIATHECIGISQPERVLLYVICSPVGPYFPSGFSAVKILAEDSFVRAWPNGTGEFKIGANYGPTILPQKLAMARGFQQILWLLGKEHEITEIGSMNCFIFLKSKTGELELVTPPLVNGTILPGVTRASILDLLRAEDQFKVSERSINMTEFLEAHSEGRIVEMFGSGTAAIVSPIKCINFHGIDYEIQLNPLEPEKQSGPLAERLFKTITQVQVKRVNDFSLLLFLFSTVKLSIHGVLNFNEIKDSVNTCKQVIQSLTLTLIIPHG